ncbi:hypothetical protein HZB74_00100 [Candidatus Saccharibacteria bacterium]|nr:hypothetical protein [Candidatus Saccharibacteria bacterium]
MNTKRFFYLMTGFVVLLCLVLIGVTVAGNIVFKKQSDKLVGVKAKGQVAEQQKVSLSQAKKDIEKYTELDGIAKSVVPQDKDQAKTVREINKIAAESGISIQQISFASSNLGLAPAKQSTSSEESGESSEQNKTQAAPTNISQVKPVEGISGVYSLEITIASGDNPVSYYGFLRFLEKLEANRRTAHVTEITVSPTEKGSDVTFTLKLNAYLKP